MILGGVRVLQMLTSEQFTSKTALAPLLNMEQSAASIAEGTAKPVSMTQQQIPAQKLRKLTDTM